MRSKHQFAFLFMLASTGILFVSIWGIKNFTDSPMKNKVNNTSNFNFSKVKRIKQKKKVSQRKKKQKKIQKKMKALRPVLSSSLKGQSFGLDLSELGALDVDQQLLAADENVIMDEASVDTLPRIVSRDPIEFPEIALNQNISSGKVKVRLLINKSGRVEKTEVLEAVPKNIFDDAAIQSISSWKFSPATYQGRNVAIWAKQVVKFGE